MNVAILMMQKNEDELLSKWVTYHSYLVGHKNLYIYDNGSTSKKNITELDLLEKKGVHVIRDKNKKFDYENRGKVFCEKIKQLDATDYYDFYMPIDCDEFLGAVDDEGNISCDTLAFKYSLLMHSNVDELLMINSQYYNSSVSPMWFNRQPYRKCFFRKNTITSLDQGFHWGKVSTSDKEKRTNIVHFHFHNKPYEIAKLHAKEKLTGRVPNFNRETLLNYNGAGFHLIRFFIENEQQYVNQQIKLKHIKSRSLFHKLTELGLQWPFIDDVLESRVKLDLSDENDGFLNLLPEFKGSIDNITIEGDYIRIKGWGIVNYCSTLQFVYLELENKERLPFTITKRVNRADVNEMLNIPGVTIGFEAQLKLSDLAVFEDKTKRTDIVAFIESAQRFHSFDMHRHNRNLDYFSKDITLKTSES
jgi:hypothetical protein